jgi:hypothetical protein
MKQRVYKNPHWPNNRKDFGFKRKKPPPVMDGGLGRFQFYVQIAIINPCLLPGQLQDPALTLIKSAAF